MKRCFMCKAAVIIGVAAMLVSACSTEAGLQGALGRSALALEFYGCKTPSEGEVEFLFSGEVAVSSLYFDPPLEAEVIGQGERVTVRFRTELPGGSRVAADLLVEDKRKNTLNVLVSFRTRNDRMPELRINEIRTENTKPKAEFVELLIRTGGNLGGMRLFSAYAKEELIFVFPPVEVKAGDYIVVHARSTEEGVVDETGTNLTQSKGADASSARDFWIPGNTKLLHKTNAIYLMDQDDKILSGVLLLDGDKWSEKIANAAQLMAEQGAWKGANPEDAVNSRDTANTRTINRAANANTNSAADWYITVNSGNTPGKPNNSSRYVK